MVDITTNIKAPIITDLRADVDGIFIKTIDVPDAGTFLPQHSHSYDHVSFIASGAAWVETKDDFYGKRTDYYQAPAMVTIKAHIRHLFLTSEPNTRICCIHRIDRTGEVDVEEEYHLVDQDGLPTIDEVSGILKAVEGS